MILTLIMQSKQSKRTTPAAPKGGKVPRFLRIPETLDRWLIEKANAGGYAYVQDKIIDLIRDAREAESK